MIEAAIDMEAVAKHEYFVKSSFDEQLMDCKQKMDEAEQSIDAHYADTLRALKMKDKDLKCVDRDDAKCFRLTKKNEKFIRGKQQYQVLQAAGGGVFFTTKELKAFSQSYREARAEYNESQQDLVHNIQQIASTYAPVFELIEEALAEIDALLSLAHASVRPHAIPLCYPPRPFPLLALL